MLSTALNRVEWWHGCVYVLLVRWSGVARFAFVNVCCLQIVSEELCCNVKLLLCSLFMHKYMQNIQSELLFSIMHYAHGNKSEVSISCCAGKLNTICKIH